MRAATQQQQYGSSPTGALHFFELDRNTVVGVFRDNSWPTGKYVSWYLDDTIDTLTTNLKGILVNFDTNQDNASLLAAGRSLYNLLFPDTRAAPARAKFEAFIRSHLNDKTENEPPSIFVRLVSGRSTPSFLIPLGLLSYSVDGQQDFLGFHFRIQTPLDIQDYRPNTSCISNWVLLAPEFVGAPEELKEAKNQFADWYTNWPENPHFTHIGDISGFRTWIGSGVREDTPTALFVLAHHDSNSVYFASAPRLNALEIERQFTTPSVAVLNACEDAAPGSSQMVQRLNAHGVTGVIATAMKVDPYLAGDFFATLGKVIQDKQGNNGYPIGLVHFEAVRRLSKMQSSAPNNRQNRTYGPKSLAYEFLGNGNLQVCSPAPH